MASDREPSQTRAVMARWGRFPFRRALASAFRARSRHGTLPLPDRFEGAIYGHLVGDALGVPYELLPAATPASIAWRGHGTHDQPAGTWSDDGALMLALLDSLLSAGFDLEDQGRRALDWRRDGRYAPGGLVFDVGGATGAALHRIATGAPAAEAGGTDAKGNGSLMRILPLPLVLRETSQRELVQMAARASRVTHGSAEAQIACALYALLVRGLLGGERDRPGTLGRVRNVLREALAADGLPGSLEAAEPAAAVAALDAFEAWPGRAGGGRVVDSFWSAWDAFAASASYRETVERAVAYGNDTDTTAAIAGGLAGTCWGARAIPSAWRLGLRDRHVPRELVDRLIATDASGWDGEAWRTSTASPLRVDRLDVSGAVEGGGTVGITFLPGKRYVGYFTGAHWRDLDADAARLRQLGVDVLLLLVEDHELARCRATEIGDVLADHGVELVRFPIRDLVTPTDAPAFRATVAALLGRVRGGASLAIACRGGLDRSGMAAACLLREAGIDADEAIDRVHRARRRSLTLPSQQDYVRRWPAAG